MTLQESSPTIHAYTSTEELDALYELPSHAGNRISPPDGTPVVQESLPVHGPADVEPADEAFVEFSDGSSAFISSGYPYAEGYVTENGAFGPDGTPIKQQARTLDRAPKTEVLKVDDNGDKPRTVQALIDDRAQVGPLDLGADRTPTGQMPIVGIFGEQPAIMSRATAERATEPVPRVIDTDTTGQTPAVTTKVASVRNPDLLAYTPPEGFKDRKSEVGLLKTGWEAAREVAVHTARRSLARVPLVTKALGAVGYEGLVGRHYAPKSLPAISIVKEEQDIGHVPRHLSGQNLANEVAKLINSGQLRGFDPHATPDQAIEKDTTYVSEESDDQAEPGADGSLLDTIPAGPILSLPTERLEHSTRAAQPSLEVGVKRALLRKLPPVRPDEVRPIPNSIFLEDQEGSPVSPHPQDLARANAGMRRHPRSSRRNKATTLASV